PAPVVADRLALVERLIHLLHLEQSGAATAVHGDLAPSLVAIDEDAGRRLPDVAALEACDRQAEPVDMGARAGRGPLRLRAAAACRVLGGGAEAHALLGVVGVDLATPQRGAYCDTLGVRIHAVADAPGELRRVEIAVAVVDDGRRRTVLEFEEGGKI